MRVRHHCHRVALVCTVGIALILSGLTTTTATAATPPTLAVGDVAVAEGDAGTTPARVAVRLSNPLSTTTTVRYVTVGGTASAGTDFRARSAAVRIRAGKTSASITVPVLGDTTGEPSETVVVRITGPTGIVISDSVGSVTIRDDETRAGISIGDAAVWEGDARAGLAKLTVVLDAAVGIDTVVGYATVNGAATTPSDYRARTGRVRIRAGRTTATVTATIFGDATLEGDESFTILLRAPVSSGLGISDGVGVVTIRNDEPTPAPPPPPPPPPATPGAPADLTVAAGPFSRYLTADWTAPTTGSPITGYDLEVVRGATTNVVGNVTAPYAFGCGLAEVTDTCVVRVRARNAQGDGPWTAPVTASTWAPPAAPANLTVLTGGGAVTWEAPASDRPIDHYEVQKGPEGGTSWTHVTTTTSTQAATTCGGCSVRVSAYSEVGFGAWSTVAIAVPGAPTDLTAVRDAIDHELVHVAWSPPADSGSHPITEYSVFVNGVPLTPNAGLGSDVFLRSTVTWSIQVYARNLVGRSIFPATVTLSAG